MKKLHFSRKKVIVLTVLLLALVLVVSIGMADPGNVPLPPPDTGI